jgi:hypothetical protein
MHPPTLKFCVLLALVASSLPTQVLAQTTPPSAAYVDEPIVIEHSDSIFSMAADGTGWIEHTLVARLQSDATVKKYGVVSVPYASSSEHVDLLYARVVPSRNDQRGQRFTSQRSQP